jgi:hypothetical protein
MIRLAAKSRLPIHLATSWEGEVRRSEPTTPFREAQYVLAIQWRGNAEAKLCRLQPSEGQIARGLVGLGLAESQSKTGCRAGSGLARWKASCVDDSQGGRFGAVEHRYFTTWEDLYIRQPSR